MAYRFYCIQSTLLISVIVGSSSAALCWAPDVRYDQLVLKLVSRHILNCV